MHWLLGIAILAIVAILAYVLFRLIRRARIQAAATDGWDFYPCRVNDKFASIFLNLGLKDSVPLPNKPALIRVGVDLRLPNEHGLSTQDEFETLIRIEDALVPRVEADIDAVYVGRVTTDGFRAFFFYAASSDSVASSIEKMMSDFPEYSHWLNCKDDPTGSEYLEFLYPSLREHQSIMNRGILSRLEEMGDDGSKPRDVRHWIYFADPTSRRQFIDRITRDALSVADVIEPEPGEEKSERPFGVSVSRIDAVGSESVDETIFRVFDATQACNGHYDGWESEVVVDKPE